MNRQRLSLLAHAAHPVAAPVGDAAVAHLLEHTVRPAAARVLDLGCGEGSWLRRALAARPGLRGDGVDVSGPALERAARLAGQEGVAGRLTLHRQDAAAFRADVPFDAVLCVGASHAFGGLTAVLDAAARHLAPGGRLLVGDAYWAAEPSPQAVGTLGEYAGLADTVDAVTARGWLPVEGHLSTRQELDAYEWSWTGSLTAWALDHPDDPDSTDALTLAAAHRAGWLRDYRDSFGFVCLVLARTGRPAQLP